MLPIKTIVINNSKKCYLQIYRNFKHVSNKIVRLKKNNNTKLKKEDSATIITNSVNKNEKKSLCNSDFVKSNEATGAFYNAINLQMLPRHLYNQIFINDSDGNICNEINIKEIKNELEKFGCDINATSNIPDVHLKIPKLEGENIEEHFKNIAQSQINPYLSIIQTLISDIPQKPDKFLLQEGWTRYTESGSEKVDYPLEDGLIFDVEVCMKDGPLPTLATAVSHKAWYGWVSKSLVQGSANFDGKPLYTPDYLIPLESNEDDKGLKLNKFQKKPKIIVGHNVAYDRIRIKEQYWINSTGTRFIDTMALHVCISGTSSYQRAVLKSKSLTFDNDKLYSVCSLNNLMDVYKLYCNGSLDKSQRNMFVECDLPEIRDNFHDLISYCATDVIATQEILKKIIPLFNERFPHPASLAGMLELSMSYLPVNYNWTRYIQESDTIFNDLNLETKVCLARRADEVCRLLIDDKYKSDPWMWDQDWEVKDIRLKKSLKKKKTLNNESELLKTELSSDKEKDEEISEQEKLELKFAYIEETKELLPKKIPLMPCYPKWYRKICCKHEELHDDWLPGAQNISISMLITPKLLNLTWENYPLHYIREHGWGFLIPYTVNDGLSFTFQEIENISGKPVIVNNNMNKELKTFSQYEKFSEELIKKLSQDKNAKNQDSNSNCLLFLKLPHKDGLTNNVGNPLAKDFLSKFSENVLAGTDVNATRILQISNMTSYWKNNRDRIMSQMVIWQDKTQGENKKSFKYGAILPQVLVAGTLTRRAVEPTWMTASKTYNERIGSELRAMIHSPPNYCIVGADVDSQELWLSSIIGDSFWKKMQGATPFSWMTLIGSKAQGTDMHSITAKSIGISRDQAKIINYARIYGAGQRFAERLLKQFNPTMTDKEAATKSRKMFDITKGKKLYRLKNEHMTEELIDKHYTSSEAYQLAKLHNMKITDMFKIPKWYGGSESAMFNSLEEIVQLKNPATPFLNSRLSRALENEIDNKNLPTKVNWVVQSGAVDFLHLMMVCMRWLMKDKIRFCLSFHDEVRYLVPIKYKYNAALAMHVSNLLVRSFCVTRLNMKDLPMSVAFFNSVEIDSALRKEADNDCTTPSNPHGLEIGYGIKKGESLNIWNAIEKSNGQVGLINIEDSDSKKNN